jgi:hypothetical protein
MFGLFLPQYYTVDISMAFGNCFTDLCILFFFDIVVCLQIVLV